ncbi:MAG: bifunctional phosphoribosylaminoimidazolecarboxamide formyltransferase/IMP cyclohydrolase [Archangiaceae bacterium]|nr:bifunctional phosphoribosylaminoimidazolecarboxamide formyltransferase/IMP cyclohydrolase [Archangiaceae bacterium]
MNLTRERIRQVETRGLPGCARRPKPSRNATLVADHFSARRWYTLVSPLLLTEVENNVLALLSVSDKRGLVPFAQGLVRLGFSILSTGGTLEALKAAGVPAKKVSEHTGSPEILGGRVKTLHPKIHGGILGRPTQKEDAAQMKENGITPISIVAVNLYPFRETVAKGATELEAIEQIDIGGPAMVRAAAKNWAHVSVVVDPNDYDLLLEERQEKKQVTNDTRRRLMRKAFSHTAGYDAAIAQWLAEQDQDPFPEELTVSMQKMFELRYGENPHQRGAYYREAIAPKEPTLAFSRLLQGKELSYNNLLDFDSALGLVMEFPEVPCAVIIKHNTPCGVAINERLEAAYRKARAADEVSAFGGVVALNREVDELTAKALAETFLEGVVAPSFSREARSVLEAKKNLRLLEAGAGLASTSAKPRAQLDVRSISGGLLAMDRDAIEPQTEWKVVTKVKPSEADLKALKFAWRVCKHVKSNAIVFSTSTELLAAGGGQTSRVESVKIAAARGGDKLKGSAVGSDAFFPFRDGLDALAAAGARCVVQPGGSMRDPEVISAADEHGISMVFTGVRHFRH